MFDHFTPAMLDLFASSLWETLIMVGISGIVGGLIGEPLGVFLRLTDHGGVLQNGPVNKLVGWLVNAVYWLLLALLANTWLGLVLARFPYTRAWGEQLNGYLLGVAAHIGGGILGGCSISPPAPCFPLVRHPHAACSPAA